MVSQPDQARFRRLVYTDVGKPKPIFHHIRKKKKKKKKKTHSWHKAYKIVSHNYESQLKKSKL